MKKGKKYLKSTAKPLKTFNPEKPFSEGFLKLRLSDTLIVNQPK